MHTGSDSSPAAQAGDPLFVQLEAALRPLQLLQRLDEGGMGEIFLARDPMLRRTVAVKVLRKELAASETDRARFFREAEAIAGLSHPNVIAIHAVGELPDGTPYFVMDYVTGSSLARRLEQGGPLSVREARSVLAQVAAALAAAHTRGVVHRDIKAQNVLFDADTGRALVTDFGVAAFHAGPLVASDGKLTTTGVWVGSPAYMSPEQFLGEAVTPAADVYAVGLLAYDLLLAHGPFEHTSPQRLMVAHVSEQPRPLAEARADVDPELDAIVARCLAKDPEARPTAEEVANLLAPGGPALVEWPPPMLDRLRGASYPVALRLGGAALLLLGPLLAAASVRTFYLDAGSDVLWGATLLLSVLAGVLLLARTAAALVLLRRDISRAVTLGYRGGTLAEVMADRRGDTGQLIAGTREYAGVAVGVRGGLRRARVHAAGAVLAGGLLLFLTLPVSIAMGADTPLLAGGVWALALGPSALCVLFAARVAAREGKLVGKARHGLESAPAAVAAPLVPQWYGAVEKLNRGSGISPGGRIPRLAPLFATFAVAALAITALMLAGAVTGVLMLGRMHGNWTGKFSNTQAKARAIEPFLHLGVVSSDSTISPIEAREALARIGSGDTTWLTERPEEGSIAGSPLVGAGPFERPFSLAVNAVIPRAFAGLSPAERAYLRGFTGNPVLPGLSFVARAPRLAGTLPGEIDSTTLIWSIPILRFGRIREAAYHKIAQAGLHVSEGRVDSAEHVLRELVSVGKLLTRDGNFLIDNLVGTVVAGIGLRGLGALYLETGRREEGQRILAGLEEVTEVDPARPSYPGSWTREDELRQSLQLLADTSTVRGLRWELLVLLKPMLTCHDLRGLMHGLPQDLRSTIENARRDLVRDEEDAALFAASVELPERIYRYNDRELEPMVARGSQMVRAAAGILRTPNLYACFSLIAAGM